MMQTDTIAAISTAAGKSGIGIVRISGADALTVADKIFRSKNGKQASDFADRTVHYGIVHDSEKEIDEALLVVMHGPGSYTTEDIVEIDCHGGNLVMQQVLEAALHAGARLAEPGEFTKRAFLGGRIDLSQAEAVMDIIGAGSDMAREAALHELGGVLGAKIREIRETLLYEAAYVEAALDDPEHYSLDGYGERIAKITKNALSDIEMLLKDSANGRIIREGIRTAIVGKPNAGKSSLLNLLSGIERAIVTDIPGTTRDVIEEQVTLDGVLLNLIDTAGIRDTGDVVEKAGVTRSLSAIKSADLVLFVVDCAAELDENDKSIINELKGKKTIVVINKSDLPAKIGEEDLKSYQTLAGARYVHISAIRGEGTEDLSREIKDMFFGGEIEAGSDFVIANARQKEALASARESLLGVLEGADTGLSEDFLAADLMAAYESLGHITGESVGEDLIDKIFSEFCMGK